MRDVLEACAVRESLLVPHPVVLLVQVEVVVAQGQLVVGVQLPVDAAEQRDLVLGLVEGADRVGDLVRRHAVHALLSAISPDDRQLIALAFFKGCTHQQIAAYTDLPLGTVKSRIRRALNALGEAVPAGLQEH